MAQIVMLHLTGSQPHSKYSHPVLPLQLCQGHCRSCGLLPHVDGRGSEGPPSAAHADQDERYVRTYALKVRVEDKGLITGFNQFSIYGLKQRFTSCWSDSMS